MIKVIRIPVSLNDEKEGNYEKEREKEGNDENES